MFLRSVVIDPKFTEITPGANMMDPKNQRSKKNLLIDRNFQGRMIFLIIILGFACAVFNGYYYYSYVDDSYDFILKYSSLSQELIEERHHDLLVFGLMLGLGTLLITLIVSGWALVITHRAAGSVYHVKRVIEEIRSGKIEARVHLREKDEYQDLANSFNQMMDELQKKN